MMLMSLRSLIRSQWWWMVVFVLLVFSLLGVFQVRDGINWGFPITIVAFIIVIVVKVAEYLTRPAQTARQAPKMHKNIK